MVKIPLLLFGIVFLFGRFWKVTLPKMWHFSRVIWNPLVMAWTKEEGLLITLWYITMFQKAAACPEFIPLWVELPPEVDGGLSACCFFLWDYVEFHCFELNMKYCYCTLCFVLFFKNSFYWLFCHFVIVIYIINDIHKR